MAELMKNSHRSDRELAKVLGVSQPTISRTLKKLEKERYIEEYTVIPNFQKLGYQLAAFTLVQLKSSLAKDEIEKARETAIGKMQEGPEIVLLERGLGEEGNGIVISFHEDYSSYSNFREWLRQFPFLELSATKSFIIDLNDQIHYRYLTFSTLANHMLKMKEKKE